jgi:2-amino-4-hydroxy-6-hydroxymethyldihydropteridine diphosphokinase
MSSYNVVLLLGSNIGNTEQNLQNAIAKIENRIGNIDKLSKMLETKPVEFVSNNIFRNIAMSLYTTISPFSLLTEIKKYRKRDGQSSRFLCSRRIYRQNN